MLHRLTPRRSEWLRLLTLSASCGAPLVARRGELRTRHFAHAASRERPGCCARAISLLRRLAIYRLRAWGVLIISLVKFDFSEHERAAHLDSADSAGSVGALCLSAQCANCRAGCASSWRGSCRPRRRSPALRRSTADTAVLVQAAVRSMRKIYRPGFLMAKAGVHLTDLRDGAVEQSELPLNEALLPRRTDAGI